MDGMGWLRLPWEINLCPGLHTFSSLYSMECYLGDLRWRDTYEIVHLDEYVWDFRIHWQWLGGCVTNAFRALWLAAVKDRAGLDRRTPRHSLLSEHR
ncbi:hypothetical protein QC763_0019100 [Podospora pseudopauciseta]|uniref:Uncharacterized protein n=1 Tax=Podospora pseudopauciseta TaxID=2093780 RepID=A0ABR0I1B0_9PEZI|nr:hypothetical protein QC763_0019100 [Podospora pseudopauciseta]